jgi:PadR family transcriptional regulator, regulatory protein PadR
MRKKKTDMLQGMLDLLILRTLRQGELNGWDIMNRIQIVSGEVFRVIPGSLYPALHRLEAGGLVKAEWGASENNRRAKFYKLTAAGKKQLDTEWETWKRFSGGRVDITRCLSATRSSEMTRVRDGGRRPQGL